MVGRVRLRDRRPPIRPLPALAGLLLGLQGIAGQPAAQAFGGGAAAPGEAAVASWLERNRERPTALRAFMQRMPKGGDIHSHLSGAVYAEHYLAWAAADGFCVDPAVPTLIKPSDCALGSNRFPAAELIKKPSVYDKFVNLWSTRNLPFAGRSGHDQFFQAFAGFDEISSSMNRQDDMVATVANRAASQHISYLELMLTVRGSEARKLGRQMGWTGDFAQMRQRLLSLGLPALVEKGREDLLAIRRQLNETLACGTPRAQPGCQVTVRFLQQTTRTRPPEEVFAQFVYAFALAKASDDVVGINLVAPEDNPIALRDYTLQMRMLQFLKGLNPDVKVALHAGELTLGLVPPDQLRYHIRQAVEIGQANRIGHGVAVMYEDDAFQLLETMRQRGVLVEICLTSNEVILNVDNERHPFGDYQRAGVPLALASDDEGISRIDLSHEFQLAAQRYKLSYRDLKNLARNSLEYSFLPGESLWVAPTYRSRRPACRTDAPGTTRLSASCTNLLAASPRARAQWNLESQFVQFEALPTFQAAAAATGKP